MCNAYRLSSGSCPAAQATMAQPLPTLIAPTAGTANSGTGSTTLRFVSTKLPCHCHSARTKQQTTKGFHCENNSRYLATRQALRHDRFISVSKRQGRLSGPVSQQPCMMRHRVFTLHSHPTHLSRLCKLHAKRTEFVTILRIVSQGPCAMDASALTRRARMLGCHSSSDTEV